MCLRDFVVIHMTQASETGTINRLSFSGTGFWYVSFGDQIHLVPDSGAD